MEISIRRSCRRSLAIRAGCAARRGCGRSGSDLRSVALLGGVRAGQEKQAEDGIDPEEPVGKIDAGPDAGTPDEAAGDLNERAKARN